MGNNQLIKSVNDLSFLNASEKRQLNKIVNRRVGIINSILNRKELEKYDLFIYQSITANNKILFGLSREPSSGGLGVDFQEKNAFFACIGESLERYCMSFANPKEIISAKIPLHSKKLLYNFQFYEEKIYSTGVFLDPEKSVIDYVWVENYKTKKRKLVPACLVYIPYDADTIAETTSTGISAHTNIKKAITSSALEVIERDSIMINFVMGLELSVIDLTTIKGKLSKFIQSVRREYSVKIFKLHNDVGVNVFMSLMWKEVNGKTHFGIGCCASLDTDKAIIKSLKECLFTFFYSKNMMHLRKTNKTDITALYEHFLYYQGENFTQLLSLLGNKVVPYVREKKQDSLIIELLFEKGFEIYYKDLTTPDVAQAGYSVVKVFIPEFIDLNKTHTLPRIKSKRFYDVPKKMGLRTKINFSDPHPFP